MLPLRYAAPLKSPNGYLFEVFVVNQPEGLRQLDEGRRHSEGRRELDEGVDDGVVRVTAAVGRQTGGKIQEKVLDEAVLKNLETRNLSEMV